MKLTKRKFVIVKLDDGRYNIALRIAPTHPLDRNGFDTVHSAEKRLNEYIKKANKTI